MDQIIFLYTFAVLILRVNGLHFLGGTITWHPLNESETGTPVAIVITQTYSWTYSRMPCNSTMIAANQLVPPYGTIPTDMLSCISNCGAGSVGYSPINVIPYCTDFSAPVGTTVGQRSDIVYLQSGDDFSVAFQDSAWRPLATNAGAAWSIAATIDVQPRSDTGLYNNAPVATMMSPIYIPVNQSTDISIPVADADGDPMRCRWSNSTNGVDECGGVCPPSSLPPGTVIYPNCTIMITGQNIGDWFGVSLMVEDFINSTSTAPLSAVPVQFLVQVVGPVACNIPPEIIGIPVEGSCTSVIVGQPFVSELLAINNCGSSVTIVDIATLSFPGMVSSTIAEINSTEYYKNLTWTPTSAQLGYQVMCAMAFDSQNAQSVQYCFKFYVSENGVCSCPGDPCITTTTTTTTTTTSTTTSMSTTSPIAKTASMNWPLVGSIIGLVFLGALTLISYLCWRYCCLRGIIGYRKKREEIIELYHIDLCIDKDCTWPYRFYSSDVFLTSGNRYGTVNSIATTGTIISDSFGNRRNGPIEDIDEVETVVVQDRSPFPTIIDRFRHQLMSIVAVKKVKPDDRLGVEGDSHIEPPKRTAKDETNNSPIVNLRITEDVKVSGNKTSRTQKTVSKDKLVPKKNETIKFANEISSTFHSAEGVRRVRVNNLLTKPTIHHLPKSSINNKITRLEDVFNQSGEPSQSSEIINKTKFTVIHVPSTYRKIDKKDLSRKNIHDKPESSINVEHVQIKKKKKKLKHDTALLESTVQTTHKDKQ